MKGRIFAFLMSILLLGTAAPAVPAAASASTAKIEPSLLAALDEDPGRLVVEFDRSADLGPAGRTRDWTARGKAVLTALEGTARASQGRALATARADGAAVTTYWLTNVLVVDGADADLARRLSELPEVSAIRGERSYRRVEPVKPTEAVRSAQADPAWGVAKVNAPEVWEDGITGQGVVVANVDTGVEYTHPALVDSYRGNLGGGTFVHDYSWWDPTGICGPEPCDNDGHGTHTMGTIVGGDGPGPFSPDIGVAPSARWIAAKGCEDIFCSETALLSAGQFILAPTDLNGQNPDPSRRPDIVNNSWGGLPGDPFYEGTVAAWRAAGIIPVFSSGNEGPGCETGGSPGDFLNTFSVGATDPDDVIAPFSSRGPSAAGKVNPDVSAPGVDVISSFPGDGYGPLSGTSMAAPHVTGVLALLLSADSSLRGDYDASTDVVRQTALDLFDDSCGGDPSGDPNNVYGDGRVDAAAAVAVVATGGTLTGVLTDADTTTPIAGAAVIANDGTRPYRATTAADGSYSMRLAAGTYTVTTSAFGYYAAVNPTVEIETDQTTTADFSLEPLPRYVLSGKVTSAENGAPIEGAAVGPVGVPVAPVTTDAAGDYSLELPIGSYTVRAAAGGCTDQAAAEVELVDAPVTLDFQLSRKLDDHGHVCREIPFDWVEAPLESSMQGDEILGRFRLPFAFPFYGEDYDTLWVSENGFAAFEQSEGIWWLPDPIPSQEAPNAAIFALWQDFVIGSDSAVRYGTIGVAPDRAFVIQWDNVELYFLSGRADVEIKLWEDGTIDVLYGEDNPRSTQGSGAVIGIEDPEGASGLAFGTFESVATPGTAWRYEVVPTGSVTGYARDANDAEPVAGALVTAQPGGRSTTTDEDGFYNLVLLPGTYDVEISAPRYVADVAQGVEVQVGPAAIFNGTLRAPAAALSETELSATAAFGQTARREVLLTNDGTADLEWELRERNRPVAAPKPLPIVPQQRRHARWERQEVRGPATDLIPADPSELEVVIDDPEGDALGSVDVTKVRGGADDVQMTLSLEFSDSTDLLELGGYVFLDVDQDRTTGLPPEVLSGDPAQDIGVDLFVDIFDVAWTGEVYIYDELFELVAIVPADVVGQTVTFAVSFEPFGGPIDMDIAMVVGNWEVPTDWAPDAGHGTVSSFTDAPWVAASPAAGALEPGDSTTITVDLGGAALQPTSYAGELVVLSNAPRQQGLKVDLALTVPMPASFGGLSGTIVDARNFEPIAADVSVRARWQGAPVTLTVRSRSDGSFTMYAPEGTWPVEVSRAGYLTYELEERIERGTVSESVFAELTPDQPWATLDPYGIDVPVEPGQVRKVSVRLGNDGTVPLTFDIEELDEDFGDYPWLSVSPTEGTVAPGGSRALRFEVDANELYDLFAYGAVLVTTNDPYEPYHYVELYAEVVDDLPDDDVVTVRASKPAAAEPDVDGELTFRRSEPFGPLTVRYSVNGTATQGKDIERLSGSVRFEDGQTTVRVPVRVLDDREPEGTETVLVTVEPRPTYQVGKPSTAVVSIADDERPPVEVTMRLSGRDRFATAVAISRDLFPEGGAKAVVLARGDDYADALAGTPLAVDRGGPTLLTMSDRLHPATAEELERILAPGGTVYVVGGEAAIKPAVVRALESMGYKVKRLHGPSRIETSIAVARELGDTGSVLVATAYNFPDALAAGAAAAATGGVVILTGSGTSHSATDAFLAGISSGARYAVGGPAARAYPSLTPIAGSDRVATALAVAEVFFPAPSAVGLARADSFADALTGGAHSGHLGGPLLLTPSASLDPRVGAYVSERADAIYGGYAYGGEAALSSATLAGLRAAAR